MLMRLDHITSSIANANHSVMRAQAKLRVTDCIHDLAFGSAYHSRPNSGTGPARNNALFAVDPFLSLS